MDDAGGGADDEVKTAPPPTPRPTQTFIMVDGKCASSLVPLREAIAKAGLTIRKEFRVALNHVEARRFLSAAGPAMEEARAAEAAAKAAEAEAAAEAAAAAAAAAKGKKGKPPPEPEPDAGDGGGDEDEDEDPRPPLKAFNPVVRPEEVKSLSSDRAVFMKIEGVNAVSVVNELLGPANPEEWDDYPDGFRPDTALGREYNTIHSAAAQAHADAVIEVMDDIHTQHQALTADTGGRMVRKSHWVNVNDLFEFLFPSNMQHPRSTGRFIVFGEYGPFAEDGTLRAGWRAKHRITDRELKTMIDEIEREDLIAIFVKDRGLTEEKKQEILQGADESKNKLPNMTKEQISGILASMPRNDDGEVSFHDLQRIIVQARKLRMTEMKKMYPDLTGSGEGGSLIRPPPPAAGRATKLGRKPGPPVKRRGVVSRKIDDTEAFKIVTKYLNRESFKICEIDKGNDPALTQNVRLLREQPAFDGWDDVCCLRGTQRGTYVGGGKKKR